MTQDFCVQVVYLEDFERGFTGELLVIIVESTLCRHVSENFASRRNAHQHFFGRKKKPGTQ